MKKKVLAFIISAIICLGALPLYNLLHWDGETRHFFKKDNYFSMDNIAAYPNLILYNYGISVDPEQVIVGQDKWLFLGDQYAQTITVKRSGPTREDISEATRSVNAMTEWLIFSRDYGVKDFKILIGPDKASIYSEHAPDWAKPAIYLKVDAVTEADKLGIFVNPRDYLISKKSDFNHDLYYQTDTHWNALGAWLAFEYFLTNLLGDELHTTLIADNTNMPVKSGGDLANFLRIGNYINDKELSIAPKTLPVVSVKQYHFETDELLREGGNPSIGSPEQAIRVVSDRAASNRKIIWLRDSFGTAMSPYMAQFFSETVQLHYGHATSHWLAKAIKEYQPDYVLITAVERSIPSDFFVSTPPIEAGPIVPLDFELYGKEINHHHIKTGNGNFEIQGHDPFIIYQFDEPLHTEKFTHLYLDLSCLSEPKNNVSIQVFWDSIEGGGFSESNSARLNLPQRGASIDLSRLSAWKQMKTVGKVRIDINPSSLEDCKIYNIDSIKIGGLTK